MTQWFFSYISGSRQVRLILKSVFGREDAIFHKVDDHYESEKGEYHFTFKENSLKFWDPEKHKAKVQKK